LPEGLKQIEEVPKPSPSPGPVLSKVAGTGVCHSDLHVMERDLGFQPPFTLGDENADWIAALGQGDMGFRKATLLASMVRGSPALPRLPDVDGELR
jgi:propanol-preferring alcohol dehydrogenase